MQLSRFWMCSRLREQLCNCLPMSQRFLRRLTLQAIGSEIHGHVFPHVHVFTYTLIGRYNPDVGLRVVVATHEKDGAALLLSRAVGQTL